MRASEIASILGGRLLGDDISITYVAPLVHAQANDLSMIIWPKNILQAKSTGASCIITDLSVAAEYANVLSSSLIVVEDFFSVFSYLEDLIKQGRLNTTPTPSLVQPPGIGHNTAIGAQAIIEDGATIGQDCVIGPGVVIHKNVTVGDGCIIKANSVIGSDAFVPWGLNPTKNLPSLGSVIIENRVTIGALCTIDRGLIGPTLIKQNTLIDNMVHIGHDTRIGENVVIAAQSGMAGFAVLAQDVTIGGQVGVAPFVNIGQGARISGKSLVHCDIKCHEIWSGNPSVPHGVYLRAYGQVKRMLRGINR